MYDKTVNKTCWPKTQKKEMSDAVPGDRAVPFAPYRSDHYRRDRQDGVSVCKFIRVVVDLLDAPVMVVATIVLHGRGIIDSIKGRADVHLYHVTRENRGSLVGEIEKAARAGLARRT
jgi:hypothetical protein